MERIKITSDNFVWHILTSSEAKQIFERVEIYALHDDDSESLIESEAELDTHIRKGSRIGIEAGFI